MANEKTTSVADGANRVANGLMGCGCLIMLLPIIFLLLLFIGGVAGGGPK